MSNWQAPLHFPPNFHYYLINVAENLQTQKYARLAAMVVVLYDTCQYLSFSALPACLISFFYSDNDGPRGE